MLLWLRTLVWEDFSGKIWAKFADYVERSIRAKGDANPGESRSGSTIRGGIVGIGQTRGGSAAEDP